MDEESRERDGDEGPTRSTKSQPVRPGADETFVTGQRAASGPEETAISRPAEQEGEPQSLPHGSAIIQGNAGGSPGVPEKTSRVPRHGRAQGTSTDGASAPRQATSDMPWGNGHATPLPGRSTDKRRNPRTS